MDTTRQAYATMDCRQECRGIAPLQSVINTKKGCTGHKVNYSKYGAKKVEVDGIKFDSKKEANRYQVLKLMEQAGAIQNLELQKKFELIPSFKIDGKIIRGISYKADFCYYENGRYVVEDVKGYRTEVYKLKSKLFAYKYGFQIKEI